jgi:hypothetical protein
MTGNTVNSEKPPMPLTNPFKDQVWISYQMSERYLLSGVEGSSRSSYLVAFGLSRKELSYNKSCKVTSH